jgi:hypothetical protein
LQKHVLHQKIACNCAAVVPNVRFGTRVAGKRDAMGFVNLLRDKGAGMLDGINPLGMRQGETARERQET